MKDTTKYMMKRVFVLLLLAVTAGSAWAQAVTGDQYQTSFTPTGGSAISNTSTITIQHHPAMWYLFRDKLTEEQKKLDTFDDDGGMTTIMDGTTQIQAAHVYVDTIYMHKGDTIHLVLPYTDDLEPVETGHTNSFFDLINYFRWFDYKTDGLYNCNLSVTGGTVYDLLTPTQGTETAYRFANGYVSGTFNNTNSGNYPNTRLKFMTFYYPTDAEFNNISSSSTFNGGNNDYYLVACDVSSYMDFAPLTTDRSETRVFPFGTGNGYYEPTLSARTIFYIVGVDNVTDVSTKPEGLQNYMNLLNNSAYQGGGDSENDRYIEEYEITYPSRRLTDYTNELVALSKSAHAYAIPNATADKTNVSNPIGLTASVSTTNNTASITLANTSISGQYRSITFYKSGATLADNGKSEPWYVDDGSTATILVTKTVGGTIYNIARFKLTFKEEFTPLTQTQVGSLSNLTDEQKAQYWWGNLEYRTPEYMEENYELLTSITFDYDDDITAAELYGDNETARREHIYPFPMDWGSSSYSYISGLGADEQRLYPWGYRVTPGEYAIANTYYYDDSDLINQIPVDVGKKTSTGFWVNVDATDAPGTLAILEFGEDLCPSSKLFVTAWIKSLNYAGVNDGNGVAEASSSVLLTITGVYPDGSEVPVYHYASSQIRHTNTMPAETDNSGNIIDSSITGVGEGTNQWFQLYFSFINQANTGFDHYALRIDNRSENSSGADYVYDEIKVYVERPEVEMVQLNPICATSDDDKSSMRLDIDYEIMMSRLGFEPSDYSNDTDKTTAQTASVDFVIINEAQYRNALAAYDSDTDGEYGTYQEEAFKAALVMFYDASGAEHQFPTLDFYCNYSLNEEYKEDEPGKNIVSFDNNDEGYFYRRTVSSTEYLSVDCLTDMMAYTEYMILLEPHTETDKSTNQKLEEFIELLDDQCAIKTEFYLSSETILKLNGETLDPTADYCAGQEFVISPEVTYTDPTTGETIYIDGVYFDWFFGSRDEYVAANETYGGVSLQEALIMFRTYYPDAEELSATETPPTGEEASQDFTKNHYDIIAYYLSQERYGGMNNMLVLHRSHLDMRVLNTGLELVIQPIEMTFEEENVEICFGYVPLTLYASGDAPTLKAGFSNINYPDDDYEPCLRLGVAQFEKCSEDTPFTINLHGATYVTEEGVDIDHLGVADGMDMLFLVDTDDPAYRETILGKGDDEEIVIGKVARLYATTDNGDDPRPNTPTSVQDIGSYMQIYFYKDTDDESDSGVMPFTVKEGYYYVLSVYFQEKGSFGEDGNDEPVGNACWGTFPLEMKIVPEYLVWTGDSTCNWNNDNHWERVSATRINGTTDEGSPYFTDGSNTNTNGFVPMLFTKVVIPKNSVAELYMAGFKEDSDEMLSWEGDEDTANHDDVAEHPTSNIMYDLMLYENASGALKTEHYRVNLCDQIHLEPGAQVLHSEQLIYNKAWTEVELPQGPWTLQATPLRGVISGDWYTKKATGTETAEYFTDITFNSSDNNRYTPLVYQRSWGTSDKVILNNYTGTSGATTKVPSYASTGWSSVYNDTSVPYQTGEGFSLSAYLNNSSDSLMFRFPKADEVYTTSSTTTFERTGAGTLLISQLVDRSDPDGDDDDVYNDEQGEKREITVTLTQTGNDYYIIGNPFTAPMSMMNFMAENTAIKGYWLESTYGPIVGTTDKDGNPVNSWGTSDVLVDPYCAFFVTTDENDLSTVAATPVTVTFTKDMQKEAISTTRLEHMKALSLRATNDLGTTSAALLYDDSATDDYRLGEDAILLEDISWQHEGTPLVYTIAGDMAVGVNRVNSMPQVPLGVFADDDCAYTITFVGVDCLNDPSLFDSYTNTDTPLTEGFTLDMEGASHGRYFIRSNGAATEISLTENEVFDITAYSPTPGTVIVSSTAELEDICVYSVGGMLLRQVNASGNFSCTIDGINSGIAIVRAKTSEGTFVKKLRVR